jgi:DNA-binding transcriptional regulator YiaG
MVVKKKASSSVGSKDSEIAEHIRRLRKTWGGTQAQFAKELAVDQGRVSQWESGVATPSIEALLKLGSMARQGMKSPGDGGEALFFWRKTGIDLYTFVDIVMGLMNSPEELAENEQVAVKWLLAHASAEYDAWDKIQEWPKGPLEREPERLALIRPFPERKWKGWGGEANGLLAIPAHFVPDKARIYYLTIGPGVPPMYPAGFAPRDVIVFDTLNAASGRLELFEKQVLLVDFEDLPSGLLIARLDHAPDSGELVLGPPDVPPNNWLNLAVRKLSPSKCRIIGRVVAVFNGGSTWSGEDGCPAQKS